GPERATPIWIACRYSRGRTARRTGDAEYSRRTLSDLQRRLRSLTCRRTTAGRCAGSLRGVSQAAGCAGASGGTRQGVWPESGFEEAAHVLRGVFVEGLVRREGYARHWRQ